MTEQSELARDQEWARFMSREAVKEAAKAQQRFDAELRKWALEFLAKLNPGKPFDGDVFEDADALVAYVTEGRPMVAAPVVTTQSDGITLMQQNARLMAERDARLGRAPFNVNTGLAQ